MHRYRHCKSADDDKSAAPALLNGASGLIYKLAYFARVNSQPMATASAKHRMIPRLSGPLLRSDPRWSETSAQDERKTPYGGENSKTSCLACAVRVWIARYWTRRTERRGKEEY